MSKKMSRILIALLLLDSLIVVVGLMLEKTMWHWIVLYWSILTVKNLIDLIRIVRSKKVNHRGEK